MSKEVMEIKELIPTMTMEQITKVCREISAENSKPSIEKKSSRLKHNRIALIIYE